jgi:hypothetical protein
MQSSDPSTDNDDRAARFAHGVYSTVGAATDTAVRHLSDRALSALTPALAVAVIGELRRAEAAFRRLRERIEEIAE